MISLPDLAGHVGCGHRSSRARPRGSSPIRPTLIATVRPLDVDLRDYPGLWPGLAFSIVAGIVVSGPLGGALGTSRVIAWGLVVGFGLAIAATLTPSAEAIRFGVLGSTSCDIERLTLASLDEILLFGETGLNVILFIPLGFAVGLVPWSRVKVLLIAASVALPFVIEAIQLFVTTLGRACQSADVVDNLTGLVIGLALGMRPGWRRPRREMLAVGPARRRSRATLTAAGGGAATPGDGLATRDGANRHRRLLQRRPPTGHQRAVCPLD